MSIIEAIILGAVQGITEFLPISSDGHLVLAGVLLGREEEGTLAMTVLLHLGSLLAIAITFRRDIVALLWPRIDWHAWLVLFVASIPAAIVGFTLKLFIPNSTEAWIEKEVMQSPVWAGFGLLFTAGVLWCAEIKRVPEVGVATVAGSRYWGVLLIGFAQALAMLPGVSRSGSTISLALNLRWLRPEALKLSFLMGLIAIGGAGLIEAKEISNIEPGPGFAGFASSLLFSLVGLNAIKLIVAKSKLRWFACYCAIAGLAALIWLALR